MHRRTSLGVMGKRHRKIPAISANFYKDTYARYLDTFFELLKKESGISPGFLKPVKGVLQSPFLEIWLKQLKVLLSG